MELETSSRLWSCAVIKPFAWSASLLLPGEVNSFAVVYAAGKFKLSGGADHTTNPPPFSSGIETGDGGENYKQLIQQIQCKWNTGLAHSICTDAENIPTHHKHHCFKSSIIQKTEGGQIYLNFMTVL